MRPLLSTHKLGRTFPSPDGPLRILHDITLSLHPGDRVVLFGPSGCGKTTLLHLLSLLDTPTAGNLHFLGENTADWSEETRCTYRARDIGMVFQHFHLLPYHNTLDNLRLATAYLPRKPADEDVRARELLGAVGLQDRQHHAARLLSGGEKQRLCIARALMNRPRLLLADEPTGNLDATNASRVRELFMELAGPDTAVVVATHDPAWEKFAQRKISFTQNGEVEEQ
jgi:ABC-type lipoprotein export system ATPase subunit